MSIADEIAAGLAEAGEELGGGYTHCLRKQVSGPSGPYDNTQPVYEYHDVTGLDFNERVRDASGTLIQRTQRTLTLSATGAAPAKADLIAVNLTKAQVTADEAFANVAHVISEVRPLAPAGDVLLFEVDLDA